MANQFNDFFINIGKNTIQKISTLAEQFKCEAHDFSFVPREYPASEQFVFDANVNINQVQKIIKSMAPNKPPGIDTIPLCVIKDCLPAILPSIKSIINGHLSFCSISQRLENCGSDTYLEGWQPGNS